MKKQFNLGYYIGEGFRSIFTHGLMSFAAVFMIVACLLIMGSFSLLAFNLDRVMGDMESKNVFLAFVDESYTQGEARKIQDALSAVPNVAAAEFVTREQAKIDFEKKHAQDGYTSLFSDLPAEIYRDRYVIYMDDLNLVRETVTAVDQVKGIDGHQVDFEISDGLIMLRNIAAGVVVILITLLVLISLFIIYNTIKLGTFTRRQEIAVMKVVGATNAFVRGPFIVEGMLLGLTGAVIAFFAQWGVYELIHQTINSRQTIELLRMIAFQDLAPAVFLIFAGTGLIVGTGGSVLALRKFLQV